MVVGKLFLNKQLAHALLQDRLVHPLRVLDMKLWCKTAWLAHHLSCIQDLEGWAS